MYVLLVAEKKNFKPIHPSGINEAASVPNPFKPFFTIFIYFSLLFFQGPSLVYAVACRLTVFVQTTRKQKNKHDRFTSANNLWDAINCVSTHDVCPFPINTTRREWEKRNELRSIASFGDNQTHASQASDAYDASGKIRNHFQKRFFFSCFCCCRRRWWWCSTQYFTIKIKKKHIFRHSIKLKRFWTHVVFTRWHSNSVDLDTDHCRRTAGFLITV